jgi:hypothetical protein
MSKSYYDFQKRVEKKRSWIEMRYLWQDLSMWVLPVCGLWLLFEKLSWWSFPLMMLFSWRYIFLVEQWSKRCHEEMEKEVKEMREREYESFENR